MKRSAGKGCTDCALGKTVISESCGSWRVFGEYPHRPRSALHILGERAMKEVKDVLKRKRL